MAASHLLRGQGESSGRPDEHGFGPRRPPDTGTRRRPCVLIVEDESGKRELYAWCMCAGGWRVVTAVDGLTAVLQALAFAPDVIVMDISLPVIDGIAAARELKREEGTAAIPIVGCAAPGAEMQAALAEDGFAVLVPKPCNAEDLRDAVERLVTEGQE
jgi:two-component system response regulator RpaA